MNKTRDDRRRWWQSLNQEEQAAYVEKCENKRKVANRVELDVPELTKPEMKAINKHMRSLGLESHIVLPD